MSDTQSAGVAELILLDSNMLALPGEVQIKTVFILQLFALSLYFLSVGSNILPGSLSSPSSANVKETEQYRSSSVHVALTWL